MKKLNDYFVLFKSDKIYLLQLSFLMLFIELVLIRWTGSNILYLSYFSNFILLGSFLGIGIGFLHAKLPARLFYLTPILLGCFVFFVHQFPVSINRSGEELVFFGKFSTEQTLPLWFYLPIIFSTVTMIMACIADEVARTFVKFQPLQAYRLDILGSLAGIIVFSLCSFLNATPLTWSIIISSIFILLLIEKWSLFFPITFLKLFLYLLGLLALITILGKEAGIKEYFWSPYYKIGIQQKGNQSYLVSVNGIPQQTIESIDERSKREPFYFIPYQRLAKNTKLNHVLIIGAGTGGDVAIALKAGAQSIDAVEIDPLLYQLGKQLNPNQPYNDPRVHIFINDGRAFLHQNKYRYDMIIFALPDSLTLVSGQSSLRLENYLFTSEAMLEVYNHLKPHGIFVMYNYYREHWLVDRLSNMLTIVFKTRPCLDTYGAKNHWLSVLMVSNSPLSLQCPTLWKSIENSYFTPSTDNHPFIYLKQNRIPFLYLATLSLIFFISFFAIKIGGGTYQSIKTYFDLFLMGIAFLLLETKNIINFALLFGTTWFVNALVFIGILFTIYLSIEVTSRISFKKKGLFFLYGVLIGTLFLSWIIPETYLLTLNIYLRFIAATALAFSPIFVANLIFSDRFRNTTNSLEAFGVNLLGGMLGGILEYGSLIVGYRSLLILVGILYTLAIVVMQFSENTELTKSA